MAPPTVVVEYAKSGRSSCKGCSETVASGALRLGSSTKDPRGFDLVKWYHVPCFPVSSRSFAVADEIKGFDSLKNGDQDELRKLEMDVASGQTGNEVRKRDGDSIEKLGAKGSKQKKVCSLDKKSSKAIPDECSKEQEPLADLEESGSKIDFHISDVRDKYKDAALSPKWKAFKTLIFREKEDGLHDSSKIAAFDFDGCLAKTSVKRIGADAWSLMYPSIPEKLQDLYKQGYKLVIFTNESNIERWKNKRQQAVDSKIGRLDNFIKLVNLPMQVFIACGMHKNKDQSDDLFRKPKTGMWRLLEQNFNSGIVVDMDQYFNFLFLLFMHHIFFYLRNALLLLLIACALLSSSLSFDLIFCLAFCYSFPCINLSFTYSLNKHVFFLFSKFSSYALMSSDNDRHDISLLLILSFRLARLAHYSII